MAALRLRSASPYRSVSVPIAAAVALLVGAGPVPEDDKPRACAFEVIAWSSATLNIPGWLNARIRRDDIAT